MTFNLEGFPKDFWRWRMYKTYKGRRYLIGKTTVGPAYWYEVVDEVGVVSTLEEAEWTCKGLIECSS